MVTDTIYDVGVRVREAYTRIWEIKRARRLFKAYEGWIPQNSMVLDIGCGNAYASNEVRKHFKIFMALTDFKSYHKVNLPFKICTDELPFGDNTFDICLLSSVLHHTSSPQILLQEALWVGKQVLIYEANPSISMLVYDILNNWMEYNRWEVAVFRWAEDWERIIYRLGRYSETRRLGFLNYSMRIK